MFLFFMRFTHAFGAGGFPFLSAQSILQLLWRTIWERVAEAVEQSFAQAEAAQLVSSGWHAR
jgi:hypothetical protein